MCAAFCCCHCSFDLLDQRRRQAGGWEVAQKRRQTREYSHDLYYVSISEAADRLDVPPRRISDLIYNRKIDPKQLIVKGGRLFLPEQLLPQIAKLLHNELR
jgi:hypothetical protein